MILSFLFFSTSSCIAQKSNTVKREKEMRAYLLVYFKDDTHSLNFA